MGIRDSRKPVAPDATDWPCIKGKGYEGIVGWKGEDRAFKDGVEYDVKKMQEKDLGFTGDDVDGSIGTRTKKKMEDLNCLEIYR
jgi:hypothetical protein